ncbi:sirohydrochlorin chelatase [Effusibacillus lacus]|uniref:Sirohydrochlorin cobaltochelatase n=1 Tax=Effusibacillus lacus TaxID=1348429 RepID=A0A292YTQ1_9BACL|nr:CbiX/SirB N-terminal domain-containing protein [Effusibacillus lacus]TCS76267.1 CbiX protein [Effusibacillus lacus]GAX91814.1 sirohydrochlorin cobaltochelatase [Effusibacillus lacus]
MKTGIVLVAHGSPSQSANEELLQIVKLLETTGEYQVIQPAYLESAEPDIPTGIELCIDRGAEQILVVPYFLLAGTHAREELPRYVALARKKHSSVPIRLAETIGYHPALAEIILDRIKELKTADH